MGTNCPINAKAPPHQGASESGPAISRAGQMQMLVIVQSLSGTIARYDLDSTSSIADVARISLRDTTANSNVQFFIGGRQVGLSTPLAEHQDASGVVKLVCVSYKGSKTTRWRTKRMTKRRADEDEVDFLPLPKRYSLAHPGLDGMHGDASHGVLHRDAEPDSDGNACRRMHSSVAAGKLAEPSCPTEMLRVLRSKFKDRLYYETTIEGRTGCIVDFEAADVPEPIVECLKVQGINSLYQHQVDAWNHRDRSFIVTTSTASGKSLCYLMPMLATLMGDKQATALVVFPTKALANDQLAKVRAMVHHVLGPGCGVEILDGDTAMEERDEIVKRKPRVLVSNPDFLSMALPSHGQRYRWLFAGLSLVVLDEAHVYKGVFGSHVALIVRRIKRLARLYAGSGRLRFYLSSATLSNSATFASTLVGEDVFVIDRDSSPSSERRMAIWLPPLVANSMTRRKSPIFEAAVIMAECMCAKLTTIVFAKTRKISELIFGYTKEILTAKEGTRHWANSLAVYRAGFSPLERRSIEERLVRGQLQGVIATNALELGIDIGGLDVSVHLGWQGSRSSLWQQAGRTGRRGRKSLAFFIPFDGVLDSYFVRHPSQLFDPRCIEPTMLSLSNSKIVASHIRAAAYEHEIDINHELDMFGGASKAVVDDLIQEGELTRVNGDKLAYSGAELVPTKFQLRSIDDKVVSIVERVSLKVLESIEAMKAPFVLYPGAVYSKLGVTYLVEAVDWSSGIASVIKSGPLNYYTTVVDCMAVSTKTLLSGHTAQATAAEVAIRFTAFCRRRRKSGVVIDTIRLHDVPEVRFDTTAMVIALPKRPEKWSAEAVHCCAHAIIAVLPRFLGVGDADVGAECNVEYCRYITDRLLLFDRNGSSGLSKLIASMFADIAEAARDSLAACGCAEGCPGCCHLPSCNTYNKDISKFGGLELLKALIT